MQHPSSSTLTVSIQQEDKMNTISWKDIIESQQAELDKYGMPEDLYTDPAEETPDEVQ
jgi:hypothetical protein